MTGHLAILLPGRGYGALGPALRLPRLAVEQSGAEVVEIEYGPVPVADDPESWQRLYVSAAEQISAAVAERNPSQLTFIAKSLGTIVLASLPAWVPIPFSARAVWLTPIFGRESVRRGVIAKNWPSLLVAGEADDLHEQRHHETVANALGAGSLVLPGADHMLEVPGNVLATWDGLRTLTEGVLDFVR